MLSGNGGIDFLLGGSFADSPHDGAVDGMDGGADFTGTTGPR